MSSKEKYRIQEANFRKTKKGVASEIFNRQIRSSKSREMVPPSYSRKEFYNWIFNQVSFNKLYDNWVNSEFDTKKKPSVDRLNDYQPYTFNNIQLTTWDNNRKLEHQRRVDGKNNKVNRAVIKYSKKGEFIKEYYSLSQAARETNISVGNLFCVLSPNYKRKTSGGFIWKYKN